MGMCSSRVLSLEGVKANFTVRILLKQNKCFVLLIGHNTSINNLKDRTCLVISE